MNATSSPVSSTGRGRLLELLVGVDPDIDSGLDRRRESLVRRVEPGENRCRDPGGPEFEPFGDVDDAEPVRASAHGRGGGLHRTVPVPVRLDDGHEVRGAERFTQRLDVAGDRGEVDSRFAERARTHSDSATT